MFKARKAHDPVEDLQERVAHLEGINATLMHYMSNRGNIVRSVRETLQVGTVERGLVDLMLTLEREAFAKAFATEVGDQQQAGHEAFVLQI
jgi:hypothetical protein